MIARRDLFDRGLRAIIQDGTDRGQFTHGDAKMTALAMIDAVSGISTWSDPAGPLSPEPIGYADVLAGGLGKK